VKVRLALLLSALLGGCVPVPLARPAVATESSCGCGPVDRLGRWSEDGVESVLAGDLQHGRVHVIVHGWAPGWHAHVDESTRSWEAERRGEPFDPWMHALARGLTARDPHAVVLFYSWVDDAATSSNLFAQRRAFSRTDLHGELLAEGLDRALDPGFRSRGGQVHLVGHSFGARVVTLAATQMGTPPDHLTLLDAPEGGLAAMTATRVALGDSLRSLPLGHGPGRVFVDNFISQMGVPYGHEPGLTDVVDVHTAPPYGVFQMGPRHVWAAELYARSASTDFGVGWSPLIADASPAGCFTQPFGELTVHPGC